MTPFGKKEIIMYLYTQDKRSSQSEATIGRALWFSEKCVGICKSSRFQSVTYFFLIQG